MSDKGDCAICQAAAHGIHFGVFTCKACASFFRRSIVERKRYKCRFQNRCVITNKVRNQCRSCRLQRCYAMGMVREVSPTPTEPSSTYGSLSGSGGDQTRCPSTALISPQTSFNLSPPQLSSNLANGLLYHFSTMSPQTQMPTISSIYNPATVASIPDFKVLYPRSQRLVLAYRSFQNSIKSLYKVENPQELFEPSEFRQAEKQQHDRLETGTASLIMSMVNEFFPSFFKLSAEDRIKVFRPFAVRFSIIYRIHMSTLHFRSENDTRICTHFGYYNSVETLHLFFGEIPNINEVKALAAPLFVRLNQIKKKAMRLDLREFDVAVLVGLFFLSEIEDCCGLDDEDQKLKADIQTELFNNIFATFGFERAGVQMAEVLSFIADINNLCVISTESMIIGDLVLPKSMALQSWLTLDQRMR